MPRYSTTSMGGRSYSSPAHGPWPAEFGVIGSGGRGGGGGISLGGGTYTRGVHGGSGSDGYVYGGRDAERPRILEHMIYYAHFENPRLGSRPQKLNLTDLWWILRKTALDTPNMTPLKHGMRENMQEVLFQNGPQRSLKFLVRPELGPFVEEMDALNYGSRGITLTEMLHLFATAKLGSKDKASALINQASGWKEAWRAVNRLFPEPAWHANIPKVSLCLSEL